MQSRIREITNANRGRTLRRPERGERAEDFGDVHMRVPPRLDKKRNTYQSSVGRFDRLLIATFGEIARFIDVFSLRGQHFNRAES